MHAIILAGGFGTRLRSAVSDVPKPLAPIQKRPFLAWLIDYLVRQGFKSATLSVYYDWQKIESYFKENTPAIPVSYAVEETPLGTGGAISFSMRKANVAGPVVVFNGDSFIRIDTQKLYGQHQKNGAKLSMVLRSLQDSGRYGTVIEKDGIITSFAEGTPGKPGLINAGIYVIEPDLFNENLPEAFSFEKDFLPSRMADLKPQSFISDGYFIDIGIPEDYERACKELPEIIKGS